MNVSMETSSTWGFLTNHAHVLLCVARDPKVRTRDIAVEVAVELQQPGMFALAELGTHLAGERDLAHPHM